MLALTLIRLALRSWRTDPWAQLATALSLGVLVSLGSGLAWLDRSMGRVSQRLRSEQVITVYLAPELSDSQLAVVSDQVRVQLGAAPEDVRQVEPGELMEYLERQHPGLAQELRSMGPEAAALLPRHLSIRGVYSAPASERLSTIQGVEGVESARDRFRRTAEAFDVFRWVARGLLTGVLVAMAALAIYCARGLRDLYRETFELLRLMGASGASFWLPAAMMTLISGALAASVSLAFLGPVARAVESRLLEVAPAFGSLLALGTSRIAWFGWVGAGSAFVFMALVGVLSQLMNRPASRRRLRSAPAALAPTMGGVRGA